MRNVGQIMARVWLAMLLLPGAYRGGAATTNPVDGVWQSSGYGLIARIQGEEVAFYDVTATTCIRHLAPPWVDFPLGRAARMSADGRSLVAVSPWGLTRMYFDRLSAVPARCSDESRAAKDPSYNFEVFWQTFAENYAFFAERGVDWQRVGSTYRPRLDAVSDDAGLREMFADIFRQLQDQHVMLITDQGIMRSGLPAIVARWYEAGDAHSVPAAEQMLRTKLTEYMSPSWRRYLDPGSLQQVSSNIARATAMGGRIGYLSIASEWHYTSPDSAQLDERAAADRQFSRVFSGFSGKQGIIVDLRLNSGGSDEIGLDIAGWLADRNRPGFTKCARDGASTTPAQRVQVQRQSAAFSGPTVVLVSNLTTSAGENIALMVKDFPQVILVGDRTSGVHSDPLTKSLPNGWRFILSNEIFVAPDGTAYEGIGVPPDILVPYEPEEVRSSGVDPLLEKALELLSVRNFPAVAAAVRRPRGSGRPSRCHR